MPATENPTLIYIDLIEDEPMTFLEWVGDTLTDEDFDGQEQVAAAYNAYCKRFQPWRWTAKSGANFERLARGESYFNRADAVHNIELLFGSGSNVYLRQHEQGNMALRMAQA